MGHGDTNIDGKFFKEIDYEVTQEDPALELERQLWWSMAKYSGLRDGYVHEADTELLDLEKVKINQLLREKNRLRQSQVVGSAVIELLS